MTHYFLNALQNLSFIFGGDTLIDLEYKIVLFHSMVLGSDIESGLEQF